MESDKFSVLRAGDLRIVLCTPDSRNGYYRGTRFDYAGVFKSIEYKGKLFADAWFTQYDPYRHDCLTGPVEEFSQNGYEDAMPGGLFLKPGVGLLRREDDSPYDWFHRYEIADEGSRSLHTGENSITFRQEINRNGFAYDYVKSIVAEKEKGTFSIRHSLKNTGARPISGMVYNHNFFTLGEARTGCATKIEFPFTPSGHWRSEYDCVALDGRAIRFSRSLKEGEKVYMGDLHSSESEHSEYSFSVRNDASGLGYTASSGAVMHHAVFWAIDRVACVEPHTPLSISPGNTLRWNIIYRLKVSAE